MDWARFPLALKQRLPHELWQPVYLALRQEALLWRTLQTTGLGLRALEMLPQHASGWSPGSLALFALQSESLEAQPAQGDAGPVETLPALSVADLCSQPPQPVPAPWGEHACQALQAWQAQPGQPLTLQQAGLLALAWREGQRSKGGWPGILPDFERPPFSPAPEAAGGVSSALACLAGFLPDPLDLLRHLAGPQVGRPALAVHVLLCQPMPAAAHIQALHSLVSDQPLAFTLALLQALAAQRPALAVELGRAALSASGVETQADLHTDFLNESPQSLLADLSAWQTLAQVHQLAGQPEKSLHLLARALRAARRLQGHLSASLAQAAALAQLDPAQDAGLEAWRQAVQLAPNAPAYPVGLALALAQAGRLEEAHACLAAPPDESAASVLASIRLAQIERNLPRAYQAALQLLDLVEAGQLLASHEYAFLAILLLEAGLASPAARAAQAGLRHFPTAVDLLTALAQTQFALHEPGPAVAHVYAALAAEDTRLSPAGPWQPPETLQRLLVECLEALRAWQPALSARRDLLAALPAPGAADYLDLARCALQAGEPQPALSACQAAFEQLTGAALPGELAALLEQVHATWAQAAIALGDWRAACDHLQAALQSAPHRPDLWLQLAQAFRRCGQPEQALESLRTASQAVPQAASVHLALGEAYLQQQALTQALASLRRSAGSSVSNPVAPRLALRLGQALYWLGHLPEARQAFEQVFSLPEHASNSYLLTSNLSCALDEYTSLLEPADELAVDGAYLYTRTLLAQGERAAAMPLLEELLRQRPQEPGPALALAGCLLDEDAASAGERRSRPIALLEQALESAPALPGLPVDPNWRFEAWVLLAQAYAGGGNYSQALFYYHQALEGLSTAWTDERASLGLALAQVALLADQPQVAIDALQPLAEHGGSFPVQSCLAQAYLACEMAEPALQAAQAGLDLNPHDAAALAWFVAQVEALQRLPSAAHLPLRGAVLSALQRAAAQASLPPGLLFRLGVMQLEDGQRSAARQVFCCLADAGEIDNLLPEEALYQAARALRDLGEPGRAAPLLERLLERSASVTGQSALSPVERRVDLLGELALARHQAGEPQVALRILAQAIGLAPQRPALRLHMADLFEELGNAQSTQECLQAVLHLEPTNAVVHQRLAWLLAAAGDLPAALAHAEQAIVHAGEERTPPELLHAARLLAAGLAYDLLMPQRAWEHVYADLACCPQPCQHLEHASLRFEMALEAGQHSLALQDAAILQERLPRSAQALAAQARLSLCQDDLHEAQALFQSALALLPAEELAAPPALADLLAGLRSAARAALDLHAWQPALALARRWCAAAPDQPLAQLHLAGVLVQCAEAQSLCQDLQASAHALGPACLGQEARQSFEAALRSADWVAAAQIEPAENPLPGGLEEARQAVAHWRARGQAVFEPAARHAYELGRLLRRLPLQPSDLAALVMALRRIGEQEAALQAGQGNWLPAKQQEALAQHPLVLAQMALAAGALPGTRMAQQAIERLSAQVAAWPAAAWPTPPLLDFLLAWLACGGQDWPTAQSAIQRALAAWEDEPAWQALAARICLAAPGAPRPAALPHLERAASLRPDDASYQLSLGLLYQELGDLPPALRALSRACHLAPAQAQAWLALARLQQQLGDLEQAAASAERAVECAAPPAENLTALLLRSEIALQANNPRGALSRAQAVLRASPDHPHALQLLARAQQALGQPEQALAALEKAIPFAQQPYLLQVQKIELLRQARGLPAAIPALRELSECYPQRPDLKVQLVHWLFEAAQPEAAVQAAQALLQSPPDELDGEQRAALHYRVGQHLLGAGRVERAIPHLEQSIRYVPAFLDAYLDLGGAYQNQRAHGQALQVYRQAIQAAPHDFRPYYQAGLALKESKDYLNAEDMLHQAARLAPDNLDVHRLLTAVVAMNLVYKLHPMKSEAQ